MFLIHLFINTRSQEGQRGRITQPWAVLAGSGWRCSQAKWIKPGERQFKNRSCSLTYRSLEVRGFSGDQGQARRGTEEGSGLSHVSYAGCGHSLEMPAVSSSSFSGYGSAWLPALKFTCIPERCSWWSKTKAGSSRGGYKGWVPLAVTLFKPTKYLGLAEHGLICVSGEESLAMADTKSSFRARAESKVKNNIEKYLFRKKKLIKWPLKQERIKNWI